eukprot:CAMPEP_0114982042 /NCGR_PEP_ID=MMETSP0216-20121206/5878_1 /TAXON_ID=223996 /ORGANISM="Protocruzia adherens, Strain Boccale" /LENGTH=614 /DNA_ID=CAMNT_0002343777 /DNA_START=62 /DNA_END=1906 /DNA_ORIENTATION=-
MAEHIPNGKRSAPADSDGSIRDSYIPSFRDSLVASGIASGPAIDTSDDGGLGHPRCRICRRGQEVNEMGSLIFPCKCRPCKCRGGNGYAHRECLKGFILEKTTHACPRCRTTFAVNANRGVNWLMAEEHLRDACFYGAILIFFLVLIIIIIESSLIEVDNHDYDGWKVVAVILASITGVLLLTIVILKVYSASIETEVRDITVFCQQTEVSKHHKDSKQILLQYINDHYTKKFAEVQERSRNNGALIRYESEYDESRFASTLPRKETTNTMNFYSTRKGLNMVDEEKSSETSRQNKSSMSKSMGRIDEFEGVRPYNSVHDSRLQSQGDSQQLIQQFDIYQDDEPQRTRDASNVDALEFSSKEDGASVVNHTGLNGDVVNKNARQINLSKDSSSQPRYLPNYISNSYRQDRLNTAGSAISAPRGSITGGENEHRNPLGAKTNGKSNLPPRNRAAEGNRFGSVDFTDRKIKVPTIGRSNTQLSGEDKSEFTNIFDNTNRDEDVEGVVSRKGKHLVKDKESKSAAKYIFQNELHLYGSHDEEEKEDGIHPAHHDTTDDNEKAFMLNGGETNLTEEEKRRRLDEMAKRTEHLIVNDAKLESISYGGVDGGSIPKDSSK